MNLNELAKQVHAANIGWWQDPQTGLPIERNKGELLMLVITELAEAVEGIRKNLMDDKLPRRKMEEVEMADAKIRLLDFASGFEIGQLSDFPPGKFEIGFHKCPNKSEQIMMICERIVSAYGQSFYGGPQCATRVSMAIGMIEFYCKQHGLDLKGAMMEKLLFNKTREDHTHVARMLAGGKKF